ncbi:MAG: ferrous iron transport protein A [Brevinematales bacterium]|nr:ferrous iron transport protein A [Brevinematales bacterium]
MTLKLSNTSQGSIGKILKIDGAKDFKKKLLVMGILEGENFSVENVSPMGSPIVINVKSAKIALRKEEADKVIVEVS